MLRSRQVALVSLYQPNLFNALAENNVMTNEMCGEVDTLRNYFCVSFPEGLGVRGGYPEYHYCLKTARATGLVGQFKMRRSCLAGAA